MSAGGEFSPAEVFVAAGIAVAVEIGSLFLLRSQGGTRLVADISDEHARPIAVSITPVLDDDAPVLKLGTKKQPGKLPDRWLAPRPVERAADRAFPSTRAQLVPQAIPNVPLARPDQAPPSPSADIAKQVDAPIAPSSQEPAPVSTVLGSPDGMRNGTETDPLKAHAVSLYRAQLDAWFSSRFSIRGKLPFEQLKTLKARAVLQITGERTVGSFTIVAPSGNATFDDAVRATLQSIQASQAELPPPPPLYPDILGQSRTVVFSCTNRSRCE